MNPERIIWGEAFDADLSATATLPSVEPEFSITPVTLVFDSLPMPGCGVAPVRRVYRWRPGEPSSDPQFAELDNVLRFTLPAAQVAQDLAPGNWKLYWCVGLAATTQDAVGSLALHVEGPPAGALPTGDL